MKRKNIWKPCHKGVQETVEHQAVGLNLVVDWMFPLFLWNSLPGLFFPGVIAFPLPCPHNGWKMWVGKAFIFAYLATLVMILPSPRYWSQDLLRHYLQLHVVFSDQSLGWWGGMDVLHELYQICVERTVNLSWSTLGETFNIEGCSHEIPPYPALGCRVASDTV